MVSLELVKHFVPFPLNTIFLYGQNPKGEICKVLEFLEKTLPEDVINKTIHHTSFDVIKENPMANKTGVPTYVDNHTISKFMRKSWGHLFYLTSF
jgi:hypothetical protein